MKQLLVPLLIAALVADLAIFVGLGVGVGALSVTGSGAPSTDYGTSPTDVNGVLTFGVHFINVEQGGSSVQLLTNIIPGGYSTDLVFGTTVTLDGNGCGNWPVWFGGSTDYYVVSFSQPVSGFWGTGSGTQYVHQYFSTGTGTRLVITENGSEPFGPNDPLQAFCYLSASFAPAGDQWVTTLVIAGDASGAPLTSPVTVTVSLHDAGGIFCDGKSAINGAYECTWPTAYGKSYSGAPAESPPYGWMMGVPAPGGSLWPCSFTACSNLENVPAPSAHATYSPGYATAKVLNPGNLAYNGGTISVSVSTGYGGFSACLLTPQPRPGGGSCDPSFPNQTIPDDRSGYVISWSVPSDASQNSTTAGWNTWELQLSNEYFNVGYSAVTIDIEPAYAPGLPVITFTTTGTFYYPEAGDTVSLTIYANATASSAAVTGLTIWAYYVPKGETPTFEPACGSSWITSNCPYGQALTGSQLEKNGNGVVGTYGFTVTPPAGSSGIVVMAEGFTSTQQGSPIVPYLIDITPHGCTVGICQTKSEVSIWEVWGPALLSAAVLLAGILVAVVLRVPWMRFLSIAFPVALVLAGYLFLFHGLFQPGGALNRGLY